MVEGFRKDQGVDNTKDSMAPSSCMNELKGHEHTHGRQAVYYFVVARVVHKVRLLYVLAEVARLRRAPTAPCSILNYSIITQHCRNTIVGTPSMEQGAVGAR